mmetsp:Transcript_36743/g.92376  ORF Transcript_36743/g.92376 Transcript_36743/m.92376 type:complete len:264 (+) Transcript_36743:510-1301(+)
MYQMPFSFKPLKHLILGPLSVILHLERHLNAWRHHTLPDAKHQCVEVHTGDRPCRDAHRVGELRAVPPPRHKEKSEHYHLLPFQQGWKRRDVPTVLWDVDGGDALEESLRMHLCPELRPVPRCSQHLLLGVGALVNRSLDEIKHPGAVVLDGVDRHTQLFQVCLEHHPPLLRFKRLPAILYRHRVLRGGKVRILLVQFGLKLSPHRPLLEVPPPLFILLRGRCSILLHFGPFVPPHSPSLGLSAAAATLVATHHTQPLFPDKI